MQKNSQPLIVVTEPLNDNSLDYLREHGRVLQVAKEQINSAIADADALVVRTYTLVNDELLQKAPRLKVLGRAGHSGTPGASVSALKEAVVAMRVLEVNFIGVVNGVYAGIPLLKRTPNSFCFSTSSSAARTPTPG